MATPDLGPRSAGEPHARSVQIGCGAAFGLVAGAMYVARHAVEPLGLAIALALGAAVACGVVAGRWGDRAWWLMLRVISWW